MGVTATTVEIADGLTMPFLPMNPQMGPPIHTRPQIRDAIHELNTGEKIVQPSLNGRRVCLAVVDRNVFIQDEAGRWVTRPPRNGRDFLKLPNNTCLDGYLVHNEFYSGDCLSVRGQSLLGRTAVERETVALQLAKFLHHPWHFGRPSSKFIRAARHNLPEIQGLTFKDYMSFYILLSARDQTSKQWLKRLW
jgi:hypothetical protein